MDSAAQNNQNQPLSKVADDINQDQVGASSASIPTFNKESEPIPISPPSHEVSPDIPVDLERHVELGVDDQEKQNQVLPQGVHRSPADINLNDKPVERVEEEEKTNEYTEEQVEEASKMKANNSFRWRLIQWGRILKMKTQGILTK